MKNFYCTNEKNNCYKVKYNLLIKLDEEELNNPVCTECGAGLLELPPTKLEMFLSIVKKNLMFILPVFFLILIFLTIYALYEPPMRFKVLAPDSVLEDQKYRYEIKIKNRKEGTRVDVLKKPKWLIYDRSKEVLSGTPKNENTGSHEVQIVAHVENQDTINQAFTIKVINTNDTPTISNKKNIRPAEEDSSYTQNIIFSDLDGDSSYALYINPSNQWLKMKNNTLYGTPKKEDRENKNTKFTIFFSDGIDTSYQKIDIPIVLGNQPPKYKGALSKKAKEGRKFKYEIDARGRDFFDYDGDDVIVRLELPEFLKETPKGRKYIITGTPDQSNVGLHTIIINYTDEVTSWQRATIELLVKPTNDPPVFLSSEKDISIFKGDQFLYQIKYEDPEKDKVNIEIIQKPSWIIYDPGTQTLSGKAERGNNKLTINLKDQNEALTEISFKIFVELPENEKRVMGWTPRPYKNNPKKKQKAKTMLEIKKIMEEIEALGLFNELKEKFNISGNTGKLYIVDPEDISFDVEGYYVGEKCILVKTTKKTGTTIKLKENYKIRASRTPIYIIE